MNTVPSVKVELDKERHLRLDFNALIAAEEATGKTFMEMQENVGIRDLRAILWAGFLHEDPDLTEEQVGAMVHVGNLSRIFEVVQEAIASSFPEGDGEKNPTTPTG